MVAVRTALLAAHYMMAQSMHTPLFVHSAQPVFQSKRFSCDFNQYEEDERRWETPMPADASNCLGIMLGHAEEWGTQKPMYSDGDRGISPSDDVAKTAQKKTEKVAGEAITWLQELQAYTRPHRHGPATDQTAVKDVKVFYEFMKEPSHHAARATCCVQDMRGNNGCHCVDMEYGGTLATTWRHSRKTECQDFITLRNSKSALGDLIRRAHARPYNPPRYYDDDDDDEDSGVWYEGYGDE